MFLKQMYFHSQIAERTFVNLLKFLGVYWSYFYYGVNSNLY